MKNIVKESKFVSMLYLIGGLTIVGVGFLSKQDFFLSMGVIVVLLGTIVSLALRVSHLAHLIKRAGLWDPTMPEKNKTVTINQDLKSQVADITKDFEKQDEKSASELIAEKRAEIINGDEDLEQRKKEVNEY